MNDIVIGLGFGDEGKGTVVDYLSSRRKTNAVVRFSGGPQAAHNVVTPDGRHHTFSQFGAGTFHGVPTLLSRFMLVNPLNMVVEAEHLAAASGYDPFDLTMVSDKARLITPIHQAANQQREINRGAAAHGSCGQGIGETMAFATEYPFDAPTVGELLFPHTLLWKLNQYRQYLEEEFGHELDAPSSEDIVESYIRILEEHKISIVPDEVILDRLTAGYNVFEGSQGVLLDEWLGFHPHTTWATTTPQNAQTLLREAGLSKGNVIGVTRTYATRHGNGPFPSEFAGDDWREKYPELHNGEGHFQGAWRAGLLDLRLLQYSVEATQGVDEIAVTHCDTPVSEVIYDYSNLGRLVPSSKRNLKYQESLTRFVKSATGRGRVLEVDNESVIDVITDYTNAPVTIRSFGPTLEDKKDDR